MYVPEEQDAELWISHDEACTVWVNGEEIYSDNSPYQTVALPGRPDRRIHLQAGMQPVLVKLKDQSRTAPFVMNFCRILNSPLPAERATYRNLNVAANYKRYEGTRVPGLKFSTTQTSSGIQQWEKF